LLDLLVDCTETTKKVRDLTVHGAVRFFGTKRHAHDGCRHDNPNGTNQQKNKSHPGEKESIASIGDSPLHRRDYRNRNRA
jgi:hypothetical protein